MRVPPAAQLAPAASTSRRVSMARPLAPVGPTGPVAPVEPGRPAAPLQMYWVPVISLGSSTPLLLVSMPESRREPPAGQLVSMGSLVARARTEGWAVTGVGSAPPPPPPPPQAVNTTASDSANGTNRNGVARRERVEGAGFNAS